MSEFYLDPVLYDGRPALKRTEREERVYDLLDKLDIPFQRADHSHADTINDCKIIEDVIGVQICKNLFLCNRQKTHYFLLMMPALKPFHTALVSKQLGMSRLSFADSETMEDYLGLTPGSVSIMGLMNDKDNRVQLVMDKEIFDSEYIRCHPCINTSTLKIRTADIIHKFLPWVNHNPIVIDVKYRKE